MPFDLGHDAARLCPASRLDRQRALLSIDRELVLHYLPKFWLDDRLVLAGVDFLLVRDVAPIKPVLQHQVKRTAREALAAGKHST
jgi:hypothetical protein